MSERTFRAFQPVPCTLFPHLPQPPVQAIERAVRAGKLTPQEGHQRIRALREARS